jgi:hypothetical protein
MLQVRSPAPLPNPTHVSRSIEVRAGVPYIGEASRSTLGLTLLYHTGTNKETQSKYTSY